MNVRGISNAVKRRAIFDFHRFNADVLICQETHSTPNVEAIWRNEWGGEAIFSHGTSASKGVAIFYNKNMKGCFSNIYRCTEGRMIIVDVEQNGIFMSLIAIYAPNQDRPEYFKELALLLKKRYEHKIVIGDFNLTLEVEKDRLNTYNNNNRARDEVENLMNEYFLKETWRERNMDRKEYSWYKGGTRNIASRIDYALISSGLDQKVEIIQYIASIKTDHRAIYLVVECQSFERGIGFWKMNTSYLQNIEYVSKMNVELDNFFRRK